MYDPVAVPFDPHAVANELADAERGGGSAPLLTTRWPDLSWQQARAVALARDRLRVADGDVLIGYKLGWTSAAMRDALGIDRPNWGTLWRSQRIHVDADVVTIRTRDMGPAKVEPELVYRAGETLDADSSVDDIASTGTWALGIEVVSPRFGGFAFDWLDNTADNSSAARVVFGRFGSLDDPADEAVTFRDATLVRSGAGRLAMGDPLEAVRWLLGSLPSCGGRLEPGMIVFTGGLTAPFDLQPGATFHVASEHLPAVGVRVDEVHDPGSVAPDGDASAG